MAGGDGAGGGEGVADDAGDGFADAVAVVEADFFFGGVDVDVVAVGVHFQEEEGDRVLALHEGGVVALAEAIGDGGAFDGAAVEEGELVLAGGAAEAGAADVAADADAVSLAAGKFDEAGGEVAADEAGDALDEVAGGGEVEDDLLIPDEGEGGAGVGDGVEAELLLDVGVLCGLGAQELAAGGDVVEEVADLDGGAGGAAAVLDVDELAAVDFDFGAGEGVAAAGGEAEAGDAGDAGQGLAAEAEGVDGGEVFFDADFAGGVAFEAEHGVLPVHAGAVVDDFDEGGAAAEDADLDVAGAGVEAVLDEFADDGGGPLDDLTGRDLAGEGVGEDADAGHDAGEGGGMRFTVSRWGLPLTSAIFG